MSSLLVVCIASHFEWPSPLVSAVADGSFFCGSRLLLIHCIGECVGVVSTLASGFHSNNWAYAVGWSFSSFLAADRLSNTSGNIILADSGSRRVRKVQLAPCSACLYFDGSSCVSAPAGYYSPGAGYYSSMAGNNSLIYCLLQAFYSSCTLKLCFGWKSPWIGALLRLGIVKLLLFSALLSSLATATTCAPGYYANSSSTCQVCLAGSYSLGGPFASCTLCPSVW